MEREANLRKIFKLEKCKPSGFSPNYLVFRFQCQAIGALYSYTYNSSIIDVI
jgi:hypothetical protein